MATLSRTYTCTTSLPLRSPVLVISTLNATSPSIGTRLSAGGPRPSETASSRDRNRTGKVRRNGTQTACRRFQLVVIVVRHRPGVFGTLTTSLPCGSARPVKTSAIAQPLPAPAPGPSSARPPSLPAPEVIRTPARHDDNHRLTGCHQRLQQLLLHARQV